MTVLAVTEAEMERTVYDTCRATGWRVAHFRPLRDSHGRWRTPVSGDGAGFPDLVLVHPRGGVLWVELKTSRGQLALEQIGWRDALTAAGQIWRLVKGPLALSEFCQELADRAMRGVPA